MNIKIAAVENTTDVKKPGFIISKKAAYAFVISCSLFVSMIFIYYWYIYSLTHTTTENAFVESNLNLVNSRIMGYVKDVYFEDNMPVKRGDVLAAFDDTDYNIELTFKKAKYEKAKLDFNRASNLKKLSAISQSDFENAKTNLEIQGADYEGTLLKIKYTQILAPVDGIVAKRNINPGQFVQPGQSLFVIVNSQEPWIRANYKETQLDKIKPGMRAEIKVDAYPSKRIIGSVESISPISGAKLSLLPPENATGNYTKVVQKIPVKIKIKSNNLVLRPGMSVTATIISN